MKVRLISFLSIVFLQLSSLCLEGGETMDKGRVLSKKDFECKINDTTETLSQNTKFDKTNYGWADLKNCYQQLNDKIGKVPPEQAEHQSYKQIAENLASSLQEYRAESKALIKEVLTSEFCGSDFANKDLVHPINDEKLPNDEDIPAIFKPLFAKGVSKLKCPGKENEKILLMSAFGSTAVTSDFDFDFFIFYPEELKNIFTKSARSKEVSLQDLNEGNYFRFAEMMMKSFSEVSDLIDRFNKRCNESIPKLQKNADGNYTINNSAAPIKLKCTNLADCYDSNAYPEKLVINQLVFKLPLKLSDNESPFLSSFKPEIKEVFKTEYLKIIQNNQCFLSLSSLLASSDVTLNSLLKEESAVCTIYLEQPGKRDSSITNLEESQERFQYPSGQTFNTCLKKKFKAADIEDETRKVESIFSLHDAIVACTAHLNEAYFTFGALENFKLGLDKNNLFAPFSVAESVKENLSMLLVHMEEKKKEGAASSSQSLSDVYAKYYMRAMNSLVNLFESLGIKSKEDSSSNDNNDPFSTLKEHLVAHYGMQQPHQDPTENDNNSNNTNKIGSQEKDNEKHKNEPNSSEMPSVDCFDRFIEYYKELSSLKKKDNNNQNLNVKDVVFYNNDNEKKQIYNVFTISLFDKNVVPPTNQGNSAVDASREKTPNKANCESFKNIDIFFKFTQSFAQLVNHYVNKQLSDHIQRSENQLFTPSKNSNIII